MVAGACLLGLLFSGCKAKEKPKAVAPPRPEVVLAKVVQQKIPIVLAFSGTVKAVKTVDVVPRVSGYIEKRFFTEGTVVKEGDPLYLIDPRPYEARLEALQAQLQSAQAALNFWAKERQRYKRLAEKGAASREKEQSANNQYNQSRADINKVKADIKNAELNLSFTRIRMPFTGRVLQTRFHRGALVHQQRDVLTTLVQMDPVHVIFNISRKQVFTLQRLKRGNRLFPVKDMRAELELPDGSDYPRQGKIDFFSFLIDPSTDSVTVRAIFPNPPVGTSRGDYDLIPGQYTPVRLTVGENPGALLIPKSALIEDELGTRVLVVSKDNKAKSRNVVLGGTYKQMLIVARGLKPGEQVIAEGVQKVKDGMTVNPRAASPQPEASPAAKS